MDHPRIDDERIIDRYLRRELSPQDEERFEEHLFACAGCLEQVSYGEALSQGLRAVAAEEGAKEVARVEVALGLLAWLRGRRLGQRLALATLALALAALPVILLRQQAELGRLRGGLTSLGQGDLGGPRSDLLVVSLGVVRSAEGKEAELRLDPEKRVVLLSLELPLTVATRYDATLLDAEGRVRWRGEGLEPNLYGTLLIVVPSTFLAPGRYRLALETQSADGAEPAGEVRFRVSNDEPTSKTGDRDE